MAVVGVICCNIQLDAPHHTVFEQYVDELAEIYGFTPVLIPAFRTGLYGSLDMHLKDVISRIDGILLPGSPSDIHPKYYGEAKIPSFDQSFDERRDMTSLALIRLAIEVGRPVLGICRGMQELNVALGGTLAWVPSIRYELDNALEFQASNTATPFIPHTAKETPVFSDKYLPVHVVSLTDTGVISALLRARGIGQTRFYVNSLHRQCIGRLGFGLSVEAIAEDGVIEAISLAKDGMEFCIGVQWHPEWFSATEPLNDTIFKDFTSACDRQRVVNTTDLESLGVACNDKS